MIDTRQAFFESRAANWDDHMPPNLAETLHEFLLPWAGLLSQARTIAEIGTGTGILVDVLHRLSPQANLVSVDLAHGMLQQARQKHPANDFVGADVHTLPLPSARFDLVVCHNSFPHFRDQLHALGEMRRVLRDGGSLLVLHNNSRQKINAIHQQIGNALANDQLPKAEDFRNLLESVGYTTITIQDTAEKFTVECQT